MANDEFEIYFQRAKIEENWSHQDYAPARGRRSSLPVLLPTADISSQFNGRFRRSSVKTTRKKSVPYGSHEFANAFPSPIPEVNSPDSDDARSLVDNTKSEPLRRRSVTSQVTSRGKSPLASPSDPADDYDNNDALSKNNGSENSDEFEEVCFMRNFKTSPKGIVNRGDSVKRTRRSSTATCSFEHSGGRKKGLWLAPELSALDFAEVALRASSLKNCEITRSVSNILRNSYKVLIIGDKQVGKTALTRQLMTSNYLGALDSPQECAPLTSISVSLDGEETVIELQEQRPPKDLQEGVDAASAYIVVFAVDSSSSFATAKEIVEHCKKYHGEKAAILMVANKTDLVRKRVISSNESKNVCRKLGCKFIELSVTLCHNVDNLLIGIVKQIHLNPLRQNRDKAPQSPEKEEESKPKAKSKNCFPLPKALTKKLSLRNVTQNSTDCENLSVL